MTHKTALLVFVSLVVTNSALAQERFRSHPLRKSTDAFFRGYSDRPKDDKPEPGSASEKLADGIDKLTFGVRPLFMLMPSEPPKVKTLTPPREVVPTKPRDDTPPTFALVARATGGTLVSLTRPAGDKDPDDRVLYQRTLVSDLFSDRPLSLSIYEDHALDGNTLRFLGIGGRVTPRPTIKLFGWKLHLELFGSVHPDHGATGYIAVAGEPAVPPAAPMPAR